VALKVIHKLGLGFGLVLCLFVGVGLVSYVNLQEQREASVWHDHTYEVIEHILLVENFLKDAETGQRGYLLTGKTEYLEPYEQGVGNVSIEIEHLQELTKDNPKQQNQIEKLQVLTEKKINEMQETIGLMNDDNKEAALALVSSDKGKKTMDRIRDKIASMQNEEKRLLQERGKRLQTSENNTKRTIVYGTGLSFMIVLLASFLISRTITVPLNMLVEGTKKLSEGIYFRVAGISPGGEFGVLAKSFNFMVDNLESKEKLLSTQKRRLSDIIIGTNVGTWEWNIQTGEVAFNERWAGIIGYTLKELAPISIKTWEKYSHPDDFKKSENLLKKHFKKKLDYYECEARMRHKNGEWVWVLDRGKVSAWSEDGKPILMSGTHQDIDKRKKADIKEQQLVQEKKKFISMASHELRTPLTGIKEAVNLVSNEKAGKITKPQKKLLSLAEQSIERLSRLVNDVLSFQKLDSDKTQLNFEKNDINEVVRETYNIMKSQAINKDICFNIDVEENIPKITFDRDKILQVLVNLISNAIKFTDKGRVKIKTEIKDNTVYVKVSDTGPGIKREDVDKLFRSFTQLDTTKDKRAGGTGLGLAISSQIIEKHHGKIWVESEFGKGSTFIFVLPI